MKSLSATFKALADETRLAMLALLFRHQELCVCDFVAVLSVSQSKASRHLRYLLNAGLLEDRRAGAWVHYRIIERPEPGARDVLSAVEQVLARQNHEALEQRFAQWSQEKRRSGSSCDSSQLHGPAKATQRGANGTARTARPPKGAGE
ncbi:MAG: hypothetical protein DRI90_07685 [Deltaproteobacteria bacterium]|nr:MAG: hypothetical protein DRI90_07685 [Deltaproteobacteria bacterium]